MISSEILSDFDVFANEYIFEFILINETPLAIGAGKDPEGITDNPIVRLYTDGKELPYIPGSSLKGVLRTEAERFVQTIYNKDNNPEIICNIFSDINSEYNELKKKKNIEEYNEKNPNNKKEYKPCLICNIFGGPTIASRIKVYNAELIDKDREKFTESIRRVAIDRISGGQYSGKLFDMEYVIPKLEFKWRLSFENIDLLKDNISNEYDKRLISIINYLMKRLIKDGIEVGGRRSIGLGVLKVKEFNVKKYYLDDGILKDVDVTNEFKRRFEM